MSYTVNYENDVVEILNKNKNKNYKFHLNSYFPNYKFVTNLYKNYDQIISNPPSLKNGNFLNKKITQFDFDKYCFENKLTLYDNGEFYLFALDKLKN